MQGVSAGAARSAASASSSASSSSSSSSSAAAAAAAASTASVNSNNQKNHHARPTTTTTTPNIPTPTPTPTLPANQPPEVIMQTLTIAGIPVIKVRKGTQIVYKLANNISANSLQPAQRKLITNEIMRLHAAESARNASLARATSRTTDRPPPPPSSIPRRVRRTGAVLVPSFILRSLRYR